MNAREINDLFKDFVYRVSPDTPEDKIRHAIADSGGNFVAVDVHFFIAMIDMKKALQHESSLSRFLEAYESRLYEDASYIELGGLWGDQGFALDMLAVGEALGFWQVVTPKRVGIHGSQGDELAGMGFVMPTGYKHKVKEVEV